MNELIKVQYDGDGNIVVSGRDLHQFLGSTERYAKWFERMVKFGFEENVDFTGVKIFTPVNNGGTQELRDHALTVDMAKELAMVQRNEKGKQARKYFIEVEKQFKQSVRRKVAERTPTNELSNEERLKLLELVAHTPEHAIDTFSALAKPFMQVEQEKSVTSVKSAVTIPRKKTSLAGHTTPFNLKRLKSYMARNGISQRDLRSKTGLSSSAISTTLSGKSTPGFETRHKICQALGKPSTWLNS